MLFDHCYFLTLIYKFNKNSQVTLLHFLSHFPITILAISRFAPPCPPALYPSPTLLIVETPLKRHKSVPSEEAENISGINLCRPSSEKVAEGLRIIYFLWGQGRNILSHYIAPSTKITNNFFFYLLQLSTRSGILKSAPLCCLEIKKDSILNLRSTLIFDYEFKNWKKGQILILERRRHPGEIRLMVYKGNWNQLIWILMIGLEYSLYHHCHYSVYNK